jgi:hypothetical protein
LKKTGVPASNNGAWTSFTNFYEKALTVPTTVGTGYRARLFPAIATFGLPFFENGCLYFLAPIELYHLPSTTG